MMRFPESQDLHVNFVLAAEFREKVKRTKEDFGQAGSFFSCETLRGVYDFPVTDPALFEKDLFKPFDVVLIHGRLSMRTGRVLLQPTDYVLCDGPQIQQAEELIEFGHVSGNVRVCRDAYERREDGVMVPRIECKGMGFVDNIIDNDLFNRLPVEKSVTMAYSAHISLDMMFERRDNNLSRRNAWVLTDQRLEVIKPRRPVERKEERAERAA